ncbi:MAG: hypothetical protein Fur0040_05290 [Sideroxydans sp.]
MDWISWLVFAALLVIAEIATGTFFLLAVGLALLYPALAAWLGAATGTQLTLAALGIVAHVLAVMLLRRTAPATPAQQNSLDVGQRVTIAAWHADGTARVVYRGTEWSAERFDPEMPQADTGIIEEIRGNTLIISTH